MDIVRCKSTILSVSVRHLCRFSVSQDNETLFSQVMDLRVNKASTLKNLESKKHKRRTYVDEKLQKLESYEVRFNLMEEKVEKAEQENEALLHVSDVIEYTTFSCLCCCCCFFFTESGLCLHIVAL